MKKSLIFKFRVKYIFDPQVSVKFEIGSSLKLLTNLILHL